MEFLFSYYRNIGMKLIQKLSEFIAKPKKDEEFKKTLL